MTNWRGVPAGSVQHWIHPVDLHGNGPYICYPDAPKAGPPPHWAAPLLPQASGSPGDVNQGEMRREFSSRQPEFQDELLPGLTAEPDRRGEAAEEHIPLPLSLEQSLSLSLEQALPLPCTSRAPPHQQSAPESDELLEYKQSVEAAVRGFLEGGLMDEDDEEEEDEEPQGHVSPEGVMAPPGLAAPGLPYGLPGLGEDRSAPLMRGNRLAELLRSVPLPSELQDRLPSLSDTIADCIRGLAREQCKPTVSALERRLQMMGYSDGMVQTVPVVCAHAPERFCFWLSKSAQVTIFLAHDLPDWIYEQGDTFDNELYSQAFLEVIVDRLNQRV